MKAIISYDQERKYLDSVLTTVNANGDPSTQFYSGTPITVWLSGIAGGSGLNARIGNSVKLLGLDLNILITEGTAAAYPSMCRVVVFRYRGDYSKVYAATGGAAYPVTNLLGTSTNGLSQCLSNFNPLYVEAKGVPGNDKKERPVKVVYDRRIMLDPSIGAGARVHKYIKLGGSYCGFTDNLNTDLSHATEGHLFMHIYASPVAATASVPYICYTAHLTWSE